jgi:hypothetical protein
VAFAFRFKARDLQVFDLRIKPGYSLVRFSCLKTQGITIIAQDVTFKAQSITLSAQRVALKRVLS